MGIRTFTLDSMQPQPDTYLVIYDTLDEEGEMVVKMERITATSEKDAVEAFINNHINDYYTGEDRIYPTVAVIKMNEYFCAGNFVLNHKKG